MKLENHQRNEIMKKLVFVFILLCLLSMVAADLKCFTLSIVLTCASLVVLIPIGYKMDKIAQKTNNHDTDRR